MQSRWDRLREAEPFASVEEQISILTKRGLAIRDVERASHALRVIGYHRLRDYFRPFYVSDGKDKTKRRFREGTSFNKVLLLYYLDRELRFFLLGPLEKLEVSLRGNIINSMGISARKPGASDEVYFNLLDPAFYNLKNDDNRAKYMSLANQVYTSAMRLGDREQKRLIRSALRKSRGRLEIGEYHKLVDGMAPWPIVHKLSFGPLTMMVSTLDSKSSRMLAKEYGVSIAVLRSSFGALRNVRNSCAHHEPIWFRSAPRFEIPERLHSQIWPRDEASSNNRAWKLEQDQFGLYEVCAMLHYYLSHVSENTTWYKRLRPLIERFDSKAQTFMGFPDDWSDLPFWRSAAF